MVCKKPWKKKCINCNRKDCPFEISLYFFEKKWKEVKGE